MRDIDQPGPDRSQSTLFGHAEEMKDPMNKTITGLIVVAVLAVCVLVWLVLEAGVWVLRTVSHLLVIGGVVHTDEPRHEGLDILEPVPAPDAKPDAPDVVPEPPSTGPDSPLSTTTPTGTNPATDPAPTWPSEEDNGHTGFTQAFPGFAEILRQAKAKAKTDE